jgi:hypothetical protein
MSRKIVAALALVASVGTASVDAIRLPSPDIGLGHSAARARHHLIVVIRTFTRSRHQPAKNSSV